MKLRMEKAVYGGASLARVPAEEGPPLAGKAVFVPGALPGELIEAAIASDRRSYITGTLQSVIDPSPERVQPGCDYYARCGGCHYQHAAYAAQLEMKRAILTEALDRAHVQHPDAIDVIPSEPWGYRNRIRMHVARRPHPSLAYREAASHRDLAVTHCPVAASLLQQAITACNRLLHEQPAIAEELSEVEIFINQDETSLLVSLYLTSRRTGATLSQQVFEALRTALPPLAGVAAFALDPKTRRAEPIGVSGQRNLDYAVGAMQYRVSAGAFFQVNRYLLPTLLHAVTAGRQGALAWDLYAGVGLFARALAQSFDEVVAVESSPASSADLKRNLVSTHHRLVAKDTLRFLEQPSARKPDLVVIDPPRAGLGDAVAKRLAAANPAEIVYISCDPATLARDLHTMQTSGYRLKKATLIDLFPQTFHIESIAVLRRD